MPRKFKTLIAGPLLLAFWAFSWHSYAASRVASHDVFDKNGNTVAVRKLVVKDGPSFTNRSMFKARPFIDRTAAPAPRRFVLERKFYTAGTVGENRAPAIFYRFVSALRLRAPPASA